MNKPIFALPASSAPISEPSRRTVLGVGAAGLLLGFVWSPGGMRNALAAAPAILAPMPLFASRPTTPSPS